MEATLQPPGGILYAAGMVDVDVEVPGGIIAARDYGGSGPAVVLVHGAGHNLAAWNEFATVLMPDLRVIAYDVRGHGQSIVDTKVTFANHVSDLEAVVKRLDLDLAAVIGHSLGGYIGLAYAVSHPLPGGLINVDGPVLTFAEGYAASELTRDPAELERQLAGQTFIGPPEQFERLLEKQGAIGGPNEEFARRLAISWEDGAVATRPLLTEWMGLQAGLWEFDSDSMFEQVESPILMLLATKAGPTEGNVEAWRDAKWVKAEQIQAKENIELIWLDTSHFVIQERPGQTAAIVKEYIARQLTDI
jgi:pimeloyl-ACP methyl ester carboxylesterase